MANIIFVSVLTGFVCVGLAVAQFENCGAAEQCAGNLGANITVPSSMMNKDGTINATDTKFLSFIIQSLCGNVVSFSNLNAVGQCYSSFEQCGIYSSILKQLQSSDDMDKGFEIICQHKDVYLETLLCAMPDDSPLYSDECIPKILKLGEIKEQSTDEYCSAYEDVLDCAPAMRKMVDCMSKLVQILYNNGINTPCQSLYGVSATGKPESHKPLTYLMLAVTLLLTSKYSILK